MQAEAVRAFQAGDYATAKSLFNPFFPSTRKTPPRETTCAPSRSARKADPVLKGLLRKILIPTVDFRDVTVREAVAFVSQKVRELSGGKQTVNVVWLVSPEQTATARVTLSLQNVPASEVLRYIGDASNLRFSYDALAVKIQPMSSPVNGKLTE